MEEPRIIITLDYEIWGDGTGDVKRLIIEPTDRLLSILNDRNIGMTVFFELEEFLVFRRYAQELRGFFGYDPASLIEEQLARILLGGHEIGLHLHPQWVGAKFDGVRFRLLVENRCLFDIYRRQEEVRSYLRERISILRALVRKYSSESDIVCFRAGGFALRPEEFTLEALHSQGIIADSSVIKGMYRKGEAVDLDYRDAPHNRGFWRVGDNVCKADENGGIVEFPIYSQMRAEFRKLTINRVRQKFFSSGCTTQSISGGVSEMALPKTPWGVVHHLFRRSPMKFDYCHMTSKEMLSFVRDAEIEEGKVEYPLTMIGHSKEFAHGNHLMSFIDAIVARGQFKFSTMGEMVRAIVGQNV